MNHPGRRDLAWVWLAGQEQAFTCAAWRGEGAGFQLARALFSSS